MGGMPAPRFEEGVMRGRVAREAGMTAFVFGVESRVKLLPESSFQLLSETLFGLRAKIQAAARGSVQARG